MDPNVLRFGFVELKHVTCVHRSHLQISRVRLLHTYIMEVFIFVVKVFETVYSLWGIQRADAAHL
jgi:hypothetical protein